VSQVFGKLDGETKAIQKGDLFTVSGDFSMLKTELEAWAKKIPK